MDIPRLISTSDVPHQFLAASYLVGTIPFKALRTDPRVSYTLYVPPDHYNPDPSLQHVEHSENLSPAYHLPPLPLVVNIHGTRRNAEACRDRLIEFANRSRVAVLAPLFPGGIDSFNDLHNYKLLRYQSLRSDIAFLDILDEVKVRWPGIATEKVFLVGFSGGGTFAHRFMYLHPERLHAVSVGAPGQVTMLDDGVKWPNGIKDVAEVFHGAVIDKAKIRELKIQLLVGGADNEVHGGTEFWEWLAEKRREVLKGSGQLNDGKGRQGPERMSGDRISNLKRVKSDWEKYGIQCRFDIVDGVKHESSKAVPLVIDFLQPLVEHQHTRNR
ncbi:poly hydrolase [Rhizodiscina lignyota]|uniref:Poly hydrolase n=1 Tax=Rhizodiscina lignyota TaxID=1504668 RepID=A0A9P4I1X7_9PEZI|nr:poly hydrolase [Rhizodiscina lignyota]